MAISFYREIKIKEVADIIKSKIWMDSLQEELLTSEPGLFLNLNRVLAEKKHAASKSTRLRRIKTKWTTGLIFVFV
jgi:hypothetical protein